MHEALETGSLGQLGGSGFEAGRNRGYSLGFRLCWSADGRKPEVEAATTDSEAHCDCSVFW